MNNEQKTYWNGIECKATKVKVIVAKAFKPTFWFAGMQGTTRNAVRVGYEHPFYIDDEDGSGWAKVTKGQGSPDYSHKGLDIERELDG